jgi:hypothetical protein
VKEDDVLIFINTFLHRRLSLWSRGERHCTAWTHSSELFILSTTTSLCDLEGTSGLCPLASKSSQFCQIPTPSLWFKVTLTLTLISRSVGYVRFQVFLVQRCYPVTSWRCCDACMIELSWKLHQSAKCNKDHGVSEVPGLNPKVPNSVANCRLILIQSSTKLQFICITSPILCQSSFPSSLHLLAKFQLKVESTNYPPSFPRLGGFNKIPGSSEVCIDKG